MMRKWSLVDRERASQPRFLSVKKKERDEETHCEAGGYLVRDVLD